MKIERENYQPMIFRNTMCEFRPSTWTEIDGVVYPIGYKVVTEDMRSLGLRKNPNILTFNQYEWLLLDDRDTQEGKSDWGGILYANSYRVKSQGVMLLEEIL